MTASEGRKECGNPRRAASLQGEGRQLQARNPALGARFKGGDGFGRKLKPHDLAQKGRCFLGGKAQIGGADSKLLPTDTQAREGKWWINASGKKHMHRFA